MEKAVCVVFADAFAYSSYIQLGGLGGGFSVQKIKPGIAYSSNLHYLLFDGKTPDDIGFFTDYCWRKAEYNNPGKMKNSLDQIDTLNNLYRAFSISCSVNSPFFILSICFNTSFRVLL